MYIWCFNLILFLTKSFIQERPRSLNVSSLLGIKFEKNVYYSFIKDCDLSIDSFVIKQKFPIFWFSWFFDIISVCFFVIPNQPFIWGYSILRLSLQCVIWWWHLELKEECVTQLTTKFWLITENQINTRIRMR